MEEDRLSPDLSVAYRELRGELSFQKRATKASHSVGREVKPARLATKGWSKALPFYKVVFTIPVLCDDGGV